MKLAYFAIKNYRSISSAVLDNLQTATILIGPNNEGKSNILQGLNACLTVLTEGRVIQTKEALRLNYDRSTYDWSLDYPVTKQREHIGESVFVLKFILTPQEQQSFQQTTGSALNQALPIELRFGPQTATFRVLKQGRGGKALSNKPREICEFVSQMLDFVYIPAIRTAEQSKKLVNDLVTWELRRLEKNPEYLELAKQIDALQKPVLEGIANRLEGNLKAFLGPTLKGVELQKARSRILGRSCRIIVDDGTPTVLERKGDGVQSLVAISLMVGALAESGPDKDIILLVEEPESHLHPRAIHQLRDVLEALRQDSQVVVTTHCPLFVNRGNIVSNFIVSKNQALPARDLAQIREILGVRASDNLRHAALIIVVEGPEDEVALRALLSHYSPLLKNAFIKGALTFDVLGGASKLPYTLQLLQAFICNYSIFLDDDPEGRLAFREAQDSFLASAANTTLTRCLELPQGAEFEDLLDPRFYAQYFQDQYSVDVTHAPFDQKKKWADRIRFGLSKAGKDWSEKQEYEDKRQIAALVTQTPAQAIHASKEDLIRSFAHSLERRLEEISTGLAH